jgi:hypothetical protein
MFQITGYWGEHLTIRDIKLQEAKEMKTTVFWDVAPCSLVQFNQRFRGACYLRYQCDDDGSSKHLGNIAKLLPDYTVQHPRRQSSSYSLPWQREISQENCIMRSLIICTIPAHLITLIIFWWTIKVVNLLILQLCPSPCYFLCLWSKHSHQQPVLKHPQSVFFP